MRLASTIRLLLFSSLALLTVSACSGDTAPTERDGSSNNTDNNQTPNNDQTPSNNDQTPGNNGQNPDTPDNNAACTDPAEETCDGLDNDCDGQIDEDFDLFGNIQNCGECGNVCAFDQGRAACVAGECKLTACEDGFFDADGNPNNGCEATSCEPDPGGEVCDGQDNNCDGQIDEGFNVGNNIDHCGACNDACSFPNASATCTDGACGLGTCDNGFEDRDGDPNNGCEATTAPVCEPDPGGEVCDGQDNDCDGQIDEDFDLNTPQRCGSCDNACAFSNAEALCENAACALGACEENFIDLNENPDDGCEYRCDADTRLDEDLPCDGIDNDCNGIVDDNSGEGEACNIGEDLEGESQCRGGELICVTQPPPDPEERPELCGDISGRLTLEGGPYYVTCETLRVPAGETLEIDANVVLLADLPGDNVPTITVEGSLNSQGAEWIGVSLSLESGPDESVTLQGDRWEATVEDQVLITVPNATDLHVNAQDVTLQGFMSTGVGLDILQGTLGENFIWDNGSFVRLGIGVRLRAGGTLLLREPLFDNNQIGVEILADGALAPTLILEGGEIRNAVGPAGQGIVIRGDAQTATVDLQGTSFVQRSIDAPITLDPDQLPNISATDLEIPVSGVPPVLLLGDLDQNENLTLNPVDALDTFAAREPVSVGIGATLSVSPEVVLKGQEGGTLTVEGTLEGSNATLEDLPVSLAPGGNANLSGATLRATEDTETLETCLVDVPQGATLNAENLTLISTISGGHRLLDGYCFRAPTALPALSGSRVEGMRRGIFLDGGPGSLTLQGITFHDNAFGVHAATQAAPAITGNTFSSDRDRASIAIRMEVGANPGGYVQGNTFQLDAGDHVYRLDPDNLAPTGTTFGPNTWEGAQPTGFLLSGNLESANATVRRVTEVSAQEDPFVDLQIPGELSVSAGSTFEVDVEGEIVTFVGLNSEESDTTFRIQGTLNLLGDGIFLTNLPIIFEPGSAGTLEAVSLDGSREDLPLVSIEDAAPTIGGEAIFDEVIFTGSNARTMTGLEIRSSSPMCDGEASLCPFIANNRFRSLGFGAILYNPADFVGVNDFDDANPAGDTVRVNVERRDP